MRHVGCLALIVLARLAVLPVFSVYAMLANHLLSSYTFSLVIVSSSTTARLPK